MQLSQANRKVDNMPTNFVSLYKITIDDNIKH